MPLVGYVWPGTPKNPAACSCRPLATCLYLFSTHILVYQSIYFCHTKTPLATDILYIKIPIFVTHRLLLGRRNRNARTGPCRLYAHRTPGGYRDHRRPHRPAPAGGAGAAREAGRRTQCSNNLKQIGLALLNFEGVNARLPPSLQPFSVADPATPSGTGTYGPSAFVLILPFMEHGERGSANRHCQGGPRPGEHAAQEPGLLDRHPDVPLPFRSRPSPRSITRRS